MKPWDLERLTLSQVAYRLAWIKEQVRRLNRDADGGGDDG